MSSKKQDDGVLGRMRRGRAARKQVERDDSSDDEARASRRQLISRGNRKQRERSDSESDSESGFSEDESGSDSGGGRALKMKRSAATLSSSLRSEASSRKAKLEAIAKARRNRGRKPSSDMGDDAAAGKNKVGELRRWGDMSITIDEEDLVSKDVISLEQKSEFIRLQVVNDQTPLLDVGDFGLNMESALLDETKDSSSASSAFSSMKAKSWVYVENLTTGRFHRVSAQRLGYAHLSTSEQNVNMQDPSSGPELMAHVTHSLSAVLAATLQFSQGLLAGIALLHLYLTQSITNNFETTYQPLADDSRRLFFILSSLSTVSAFSMYLRESESREIWGVMSALRKARIYIIMVLYVTALFFSLMMMPTDNKLKTVPTEVGSGEIDLWLAYEYLRSFSSILGWILICNSIHEENQEGRRLLTHCVTLRTELEQQKLRLANVSGKQLDSVSAEELESLVSLQRAALKSTERAIEYYKRRADGLSM